MSPWPHWQLPLLHSQLTLPASVGAVFLFVARPQKHKVPDLGKPDIYHCTNPNWTLKYFSVVHHLTKSHLQTSLLLQVTDNYIHIYRIYAEIYLESMTQHCLSICVF